MPAIAIILLTYARTGYALRTVRALAKHLKYSGKIVWYVIDDGSHPDHMRIVTSEITGLYPESEMRSWSRRAGYGANANKVWGEVTGRLIDVSLWMEDDWELTRDLEIAPYVNLLHDREKNVGMVRLGHLPINLELKSAGYQGRMYLDVMKTAHYAFSGNPHLKHRRFLQYGGYPEGRNPGDTEVAYDYQIRSRPGPSIWWPLAIGDNPFFGHIGEVQSYEA